jgi:hypothetical protein
MVGSWHHKRRSNGFYSKSTCEMSYWGVVVVFALTKETLLLLLFRLGSHLRNLAPTLNHAPQISYVAPPTLNVANETSNVQSQTRWTSGRSSTATEQLSSALDAQGQRWLEPLAASKCTSLASSNYISVGCCCFLRSLAFSPSDRM